MIDTTHATPDLFAALAAAQAEVENAAKTSSNPHFRSKYADLAEVLNTVRPVFAKHGLSIIQATGFSGTLVSVETILGHSGGGYLSSVASCVPAKTDAQGIGSATTYLRRYGLAAMAGVAQEDDDGNSAAHNTPPERIVFCTEQQVATIIEMMLHSGVDREKFLAWLGVANPAEIPAARYDAAVKTLQARIDKNEAEAHAEDQRDE